MLSRGIKVCSNYMLYTNKKHFNEEIILGFLDQEKHNMSITGLYFQFLNM